MIDRHIYPEGLVVEEHVVFRLADLCRASGAQPQQVQGLIDEGILVPSGAQPDNWEFPGNSLARARIAIRLMRDLELNLAGAAIVLDLLAEIELLRSHPQRD